MIENYHHKSSKIYPKIRIHKGLPKILPLQLQKLLKCALLHDFVHTKKHKSKIYYEVDMKDKEFLELLKLHHSNLKHPIIQTFQYYDHLASIMTRKFYSPKTNRYNWKSKENIDFKELNEKIMECDNNIWNLYRFIHQSKELGQLNESLHFGHTSLKKHLMIIVNLIVQDFKQGKDEDFLNK